MPRAKAAPESAGKLTVETVPIDSVMLDPTNLRRHPERSIEALKASLARFGQQRAILVDANNVVRAGNGTLEAARALGWTEIVVSRSRLTGSEMTAYAIADNHIPRLSEDDDDALGQTLRALQAEDFDLSAIGFTDDEVDALFSEPEPDGDGEPEVGGVDDLPEKYEIIVECRDEEHQRATFESLQADGHTCRVITF